MRIVSLAPSVSEYARRGNVEVNPTPAAAIKELLINSRLFNFDITLLSFHLFCIDKLFLHTFRRGVSAAALGYLRAIRGNILFIKLGDVGLLFITFMEIEPVF